jgi:hypothetical protein
MAQPQQPEQLGAHLLGAVLPGVAEAQEEALAIGPIDPEGDVLLAVQRGDLDLAQVVGGERRLGDPGRQGVLGLPGEARRSGRSDPSRSGAQISPSS